MTKDARHIIFYGRVQGVGFRYTTARIAAGYAVTGQVKNLPDGSVELYAEGETTVLRDFISEVQTVMRTNIRQADIHETSYTGRFTEFSIAH